MSDVSYFIFMGAALYLMLLTLLITKKLVKKEIIGILLLMIHPPFNYGLGWVLWLVDERLGLGGYLVSYVIGFFFPVSLVLIILYFLPRWIDWFPGGGY